MVIFLTKHTGGLMITVNTVKALLVELTSEQFESLAFYTSCYSRKKYVATNDEVRIFLKEFVSPDEYNNLDNVQYVIFINNNL